jgi:hypothetical protein
MSYHRHAPGAGALAACRAAPAQQRRYWYEVRGLLDYVQGSFEHVDDLCDALHMKLGSLSTSVDTVAVFVLGPDGEFVAVAKGRLCSEAVPPGASRSPRLPGASPLRVTYQPPEALSRRGARTHPAESVTASHASDPPAGPLQPASAAGTLVPATLLLDTAGRAQAWARILKYIDTCRCGNDTETIRRLVAQLMAGSRSSSQASSTESAAPTICAMFTDRLRSYVWVPKGNSTFASWYSTDSMLPPAGTLMNCWEMALVILCIRDNLTKDDLAQQYPEPDSDRAIDILGLKQWKDKHQPPVVDGAVIGWFHPAVGLAHVVVCIGGKCVSFWAVHGQHPRFVPLERFRAPSIPVNLPKGHPPADPAELARYIPQWRSQLLPSDVEAFDRAVDLWAAQAAEGAGPSINDITNVVNQFKCEEDRVVGAQSALWYSDKFVVH